MRLDIEALLAADPKPADLADRLAALLRARGNDHGLLQRCMEALAPADEAAGLAWAIGVQESCPQPLYAVLAEIADAEGEEAPRLRFGDRLAATAAEGFAAMARAYAAAIEGRPVAPADVAVVRAGHGPAMTWLRFVKPMPAVLPLFTPTEAQEARLAAEGIALPALRDFLAGWMRPLPAWEAVVEAARLPGEAARARVAEAEAEAAWVDRALIAGGVTMADPLDGQVLKAVDAFYTGGRPTYLFRGVEPFLLLTAGPWSAPAGLFLPRCDLVLSFERDFRGQLLGGGLAGRLLSFIKRHVAPPPPAVDPAPGPTLGLPAVDNFAHQLWNFQAGIERLIRLGLVGKLGAVRYSGTEFFGPLGEIFPELAGIRIERPVRSAGLDTPPGAPSALPLPASGYLVPRSLTDRIVALARTRSRGRPDAVEPADIPRGKGTAVVWLGLRVRGRAWVGQEDGSIEIIRRFAARRPDTVFLLDGFSYPMGEDGSSHIWADAVAELHAMAARIRAAALDPARVVNMVGNTMRESCLWARETDVYLAAYGSTQHKVAWFSDAPGLVYVPPAVSERQALRSCGFCAAEDAAPPRVIYGEPVPLPEREVGPRRSYAPSNVYMRLDTDEVAGILWELLERRLSARRPRPAAPRNRRAAARAGITAG